MPQYLLKLSLALAVVYLFYWVLLRRVTFYNWNRWFLLLYPAACLLIPFVDVGGLLEKHGLQDAVMVSYIPAIVIAGPEPAAVASTATGWIRGAGILMLAGSLLMLVRLLFQYLSLRRLVSSAVLLSDGEVRLFHLDRQIIPFSTSKAIYVNRNLHQENELKEIIRHEFIHIRQRHALDLWWGELLCILNWYNPFAWLIRKAIRQNLEYIADHQVLQSGYDRKQYQLLLLKVTGIASFSFTSHFNFSSLKKRIVMMNKNKTAQVHLVRFLFIVPLLAVVLLAFRNVGFKHTPIAVSHTDTLPSKSKNQEAANPPTPPAAPGKVKVALAPPPPAPVYVVEAPAPPAAIKGSIAPVPPAPAEAVAPATAPAPPQKVGGVIEMAPARPASGAGRRIAGTGNLKAGTSAGEMHAGEGTISGEVVMVRSEAKERERKLFDGEVIDVKVESRPGGTTAMAADVIELRPEASSRNAFGPVSVSPLIEIKNTFTREQLEQAIEGLNKKGYALEWKNIQFQDGKLFALDGVIGYGASREAFSIDSFSTIAIYSYENNPDKYLIKVLNGRISFASK